MRPLLCLSVSLALLASASYADNADLVKDFERVLFPIWTETAIPGANGSMWAAQALIANPTSEAVVVFPVVSNYGHETGPISPRTSWDMTFTNNAYFSGPPDDNPGRIAYVSRDGANSLVYQNRLIDRSRLFGDALPVMDVPVVRERDLRLSTIVLPEIPLDPRFRLMLRIYDPFQISDAQVLVRFRAERLGNNIDTIAGGFRGSQPSVLIGTQTLALEVKPVLPGEPNLEPGYAQTIIDLRKLAPIPAYSQSLVVEVEPLTPNLQFWAFITATNNETQRVLAITPH